MNFPGDLKYSESHEWVRLEGETAVIGITDFAQDQLGDVTFVELPEVGATLIEGSEMGSVESVKAASDLFAPVSGKVLEVNQTLQASPEILNSDPYDQGWMLKVQLSAKPTTLIAAEEYQKLL